MLSTILLTRSIDDTFDVSLVRSRSTFVGEMKLPPLLLLPIISGFPIELIFDATVDVDDDVVGIDDDEDDVDDDAVAVRKRCEDDGNADRPPNGTYGNELVACVLVCRWHAIGALACDLFFISFISIRFGGHPATFCVKLAVTYDE